jgi:regulator of nucleoside diphosphate kinase
MMNDLTKRGPVTISTVDCRRLQELLRAAKQFASPPPTCVRDLEDELQRASVVPPEQIPPYVVTMNTCVKLIDTDTGQERWFTLVFPRGAELEKGQLSVFSDLGVAILGNCVGDTIDWECPEGRKHIRIDMIGFQPEATRQYAL